MIFATALLPLHTECPAKNDINKYDAMADGPQVAVSTNSVFAHELVVAICDASATYKP